MLPASEAFLFFCCTAVAGCLNSWWQKSPKALRTRLWCDGTNRKKTTLREKDGKGKYKPWTSTDHFIVYICLHFYVSPWNSFFLHFVYDVHIWSHMHIMRTGPILRSSSYADIKPNQQPSGFLVSVKHGARQIQLIPALGNQDPGSIQIARQAEIGAADTAG